MPRKTEEVLAGDGWHNAVELQIFQRIHTWRLLLEFDDTCSGWFEPLMEVPDDKWGMLGLISNKNPGIGRQQHYMPTYRSGALLLPPGPTRHRSGL